MRNDAFFCGVSCGSREIKVLRRTSRFAMTSYRFGEGYIFSSRMNQTPVTLSLLPSSPTSLRCTTYRFGGFEWPITYSKPALNRCKALRGQLEYYSQPVERYAQLLLCMAVLEIRVHGLLDHRLYAESMVVRLLVPERGHGKIV